MNSHTPEHPTVNVNRDATHPPGDSLQGAGATDLAGLAMATVTPRAAMHEMSSPQKREEAKAPGLQQHLLWPFKFALYMTVYVLVICALLYPVPPCPPCVILCLSEILSRLCRWTTSSAIQIVTRVPTASRWRGCQSLNSPV